jgi:hypothetical protein
MPLDPHVEDELEARLRPLRAAQPGISNTEAAKLLPEHLRQPLWERAVDRYLRPRLDELSRNMTRLQDALDSTRNGSDK